MAGNPWKRLRGILPGDTTEVGVVQAQLANGTTTVSLVGGGVVTVSGTGFGSGVSVFIRGGAIVSGAPALSSVDIEV